MKKEECFNQIYELLRGCVNGVNNEEEYVFLRRIFENEYAFYYESRLNEWNVEHERIVEDYPNLVDNGQYYTMRNIIARLITMRYC